MFQPQKLGKESDRTCPSSFFEIIRADIELLSCPGNRAHGAAFRRLRSDPATEIDDRKSNAPFAVRGSKKMRMTYSRDNSSQLAIRATRASKGKGTGCTHYTALGQQPIEDAFYFPTTTGRRTILCTRRTVGERGLECIPTRVARDTIHQYEAALQRHAHTPTDWVLPFDSIDIDIDATHRLAISSRVTERISRSQRGG